MSEERRDRTQGPEAVAEHEAGAAVEPAPEETGADDLASRLEAAEARAQENWEQLLRAQAELENQRRRAERELDNARKYALERFVQELLPVKDSLEMGLSAIAEVDEGDEAVHKLKEGTELTLKMFHQVLEKFGVREINPVGEPFDPELHQAMSMLESVETAPNTVLSVMQKGYTLNDRLIRPAMVVVSKAPEEGGGGRVDEQA